MTMKKVTSIRHKYNKYKMCLNITMVIGISNMKKLINTEAELKKSIAYKKSIMLRCSHNFSLAV